MPFDPTFPASSIFLVSADFRAQFNGLFDLIQAIPAGPQGLQGVPGNDGIQGPPFSQAIMDAVNTLNPGEPATATVSFDGTNVHFVFSIPRGNDGAMGLSGQDGSPGGTGQTGSQGPPFANAIMDAVTTLNPGDAAQGAVSFDGSNVHFSFGIPRGADGTNGTNGTDGSNGTNGAPGEVTTAQLASAIIGTSSNTNAVPTMSLVVSDPPTQAEMQAISNKLDELLLALRR